MLAQHATVAHGHHDVLHGPPHEVAQGSPQGAVTDIVRGVKQAQAAQQGRQGVAMIGVRHADGDIAGVDGVLDKEGNKSAGRGGAEDGLPRRSAVRLSWVIRNVVKDGLHLVQGVTTDGLYPVSSVSEWGLVPWLGLPYIGIRTVTHHMFTCMYVCMYVCVGDFFGWLTGWLAAAATATATCRLIGG